MATPLPPDPYRALGVSSTASAAEIKLAYRKAALRCHPDKTKDNGDEFVRIQQAWELIGKEEERSRYDDLVKLESLRAQRPNLQRPYESRTFSAPASTPLYTARTYEDRTPRYSPYEEPHRYDPFDKDEVNRASSRKHAEYERRSSVKTPRDEAPPPLRRENSNKARERAADKRQREQHKQRDRGQKYTMRAGGYSSPEDEGSPPRPARTTSSSNVRDYNRPPTESARPMPPRRNSIGYDPNKYNDLADDAREHIARNTRAESSSFDKHAPPSSYRAVPVVPDADGTKSTRGNRPPLTRRSSTRSNAGSRDSDRDTLSEANRSHSTSNMSTSASTRERRSSRASDPRFSLPKLFTKTAPSSTADGRRSHHEDDHHDPMRPGFHRAQTMPPESSARPSSRTYSATPINPSNLRYTETPTSATGHSNAYPFAYPPPYNERHDSARDSGYSTSSPSETPVPSETTDASNPAFKSKHHGSRDPSTPAESFPLFDNHAPTGHYSPHTSHTYPKISSPVDYSNGRPTVPRTSSSSHGPSSYHPGSYRSTPPPSSSQQQGPSSPQRPRQSRRGSYSYNDTNTPPPPPPPTKSTYMPSTEPPGIQRRQSTSKRSTSYSYSSPRAPAASPLYGFVAPSLDRSFTAPPRANKSFFDDNRRTTSPIQMSSANSSFERSDRERDYRPQTSTRSSRASPPPPRSAHRSHDDRDHVYDVRERDRLRMDPGPRRNLPRSYTFSP